jgi:hypothetical protein
MDAVVWPSHETRSTGTLYNSVFHKGRGVGCDVLTPIHVVRVHCLRVMSRKRMVRSCATANMEPWRARYTGPAATGKAGGGAAAREAYRTHRKHSACRAHPLERRKDSTYTLPRQR